MPNTLFTCAYAFPFHLDCQRRKLNAVVTNSDAEEQKRRNSRLKAFPIKHRSGRVRLAKFGLTGFRDSVVFLNHQKSVRCARAKRLLFSASRNLSSVDEGKRSAVDSAFGGLVVSKSSDTIHRRKSAGRFSANGDDVEITHACRSGRTGTSFLITRCSL